MSVLHQTALSVIDAYNAWEIEKIMAVRAPECIQEMLPSTSGALSLFCMYDLLTGP